MGFATVALAIASAATTVNLYQDATVNGVRLPAGEYRMEVKDNTVVLQHGKHKAEAPISRENTSKNRQTALKFDREGSDMSLREIRVGGSSERLILTDTNAKTDLQKPAGAQ